MATITLGPEQIKVEGFDDLIIVDAYIEFQTTADVLNYYEILKDNGYSSVKRNLGDKVTDLWFGVDTAKQLKRFFKQLEYRAELEENKQ